MDAIPLEARLNGAAHELLAPLGLCDSRAGGRICRQQRERAAENLEDLPAEVARGEAAGGGGDILLEAAGRLLFSGFRVGGLQAGGRRDQGLPSEWTQTPGSRRRAGIQGVEAAGRAQYRILWTRFR